MNKVFPGSEPAGQGPLYTAQVPSNIALVKYWGKRDPTTQWPSGDSLSMTLSKAHTQTKARLADQDSVVFAGKPLDLQRRDDPQARKIAAHLDRLRQQIRVQDRVAIITRNTFPSDCGIASSASGFGALTIAAAGALTRARNLADLAERLGGYEALAHLARMGSGSAGRSFFGGFVRWDAGAAPDQQRLTEVAGASHWDLADVIVIVSRDKKPVPSSVAHQAAWTSPLFEARLAGLPRRLSAVQAAIRARDLDSLGDAIEAEALEMHGVILSADPAVPYLTKTTGHLLAWIRKRRSEGRLPAYFTVDAGPNVHLLCRYQDAEDVALAVTREFDVSSTIIDRVGKGPELTVADKDVL